MYVPSHFEPDAEDVHELMARHGAADLVTMTDHGLVATLLPFVYDRENARLTGHVARNNDQWRLPVTGEALVIMRGPDSYISPVWYEESAAHGRVVPTWNYLTAHVYGALRVRDDPEWLARHVRELTELHEAGTATPWSVEQAPAPFVDGLLRAIVGLEIEITRVEAKFKLSQNRPDGDVDGVVRGLESIGDPAGAAAVRRHHRAGAGAPVQPTGADQDASTGSICAVGESGGVV